MPRPARERCSAAGRLLAEHSRSWSRSSSSASPCSTAPPHGSRGICDMNPTHPATDVDNGSSLNEALAENERLRTRVASLEAELVETQARTDAVVGEWQERAYWLDRWHLDLNALMRRPGASELREVLKALRAVAWRIKRVKRRLMSS